MTKHLRPPFPEHSAVDWATLRPAVGGALVDVRCLWCKTVKPDRASQVSYRIKRGDFTGYCYKDRLIQTGRRRTEWPDHPAVDWADTKIIMTGRQRLTKVKVTCPKCLSARYTAPNSVAGNISNGRFTGECKPCSPFAKKREWVILSEGRKIDPEKGYVRLSMAAIAPEDLALVRAMNRKGSATILEHRLVMAKTVGRPLRSNELVDHMDGHKTNNDPANLRLYIRGKNMPGETTGYGTYYHEWQLALAEIKRLKG